MLSDWIPLSSLLCNKLKMRIAIHLHLDQWPLHSEYVLGASNRVLINRNLALSICPSKQYYPTSNEQVHREFSNPIWLAINTRFYTPEISYRPNVHIKLMCPRRQTEIRNEFPATVYVVIQGNNWVDGSRGHWYNWINEVEFFWLFRTRYL